MDISTLLNRKSRQAAYDALSPEAKKLYDSAMNTTSSLTDVGAVLGGTMSAMANIPGEEPNIFNSVLGGALTGIGGGPLGIAAGALSGGLSSAARYQDYINQQAYSTPDVTKKGVSPNAFMEEGGATPFTKVQTEKGEVILLPNGTLVDVLAVRPHSKEKKDKVTDMLMEGSYVFSHKLQLDTRKLSDKEDILAQFPGVYSEQGNAPMEEFRLTDILGKKKMSFADAVKLIRKKIPTQDASKDIFVEQSNAMNKETRIPYLMKLMEMQEIKKSKKKSPKMGDVIDVSEEELNKLRDQGYTVEIQNAQDEDTDTEDDANEGEGVKPDGNEED